MLSIRRASNHDGTVFCFDPFFGFRRNFVNRNRWNHFSGKLVFCFDARHWLFYQVILCIFASIAVVRYFIPLLEAILHIREQIGFGPLQLSFAKTMCFNPLSFNHNSFERLRFFIRIRGYTDAVGIVTPHQSSAPCTARNKRRCSFLQQLLDTHAGHGVVQRGNIGISQVSIGFLLSIFIFIENINIDLRLGCFVVRSQHIISFFVIRHLKCWSFLRILNGLNGWKQRFHFLFYLIYIDIAHNGDRLQISAVPVVIKLTQRCRIVVLNNGSVSNDIALSPFWIFQHHRKPLPQHPKIGVTTRPPLFTDDATLQVNFVFLQQQEIRPVV